MKSCLSCSFLLAVVGVVVVVAVGVCEGGGPQKKATFARTGSLYEFLSQEVARTAPGTLSPSTAHRVRELSAARDRRLRYTLEEEEPQMSAFKWSSWDLGPPCRYFDPPAVAVLDVAGNDNITKAVNFVEFIASTWHSQLKSLGDFAFNIQLIYNQQVLTSQNFGVLKVGSSTAPTDASIYRLGSVTKVFTSLMYLKLVSEGAVAADAVVQDFFNPSSPPTWSTPDPYVSNITLSSLAEHSSGLVREIADCNFVDTCNETSVFEAVSRIPVIAPPYSLPHYSNFGAALLGRCVERATPQALIYEDYLIQEVFEPLGMTSSGFFITPEVENQMPVGYTIINNKVVPSPGNYANYGWINPAAGMYASPNDLATFVKWVFSENTTIGGTVLGTGALNEYLMAGVDFSDGLSGFGRGTFERFYANGYWTSTKGGLIGGYGTSIAMMTDLKIGVTCQVALSDGGDPAAVTAQILDGVVDYIMGAVASQADPPFLPSESVWAPFLGVYGVPGLPLVSFSNPSNSSSTGMLEGELIFVGYKLYMIFDEAQTGDGLLGFRYVIDDPTLSCITRYELGDRGVAYFYEIEGVKYVSITDLAIYNIPLLSSEF